MIIIQRVENFEKVFSILKYKLRIHVGVQLNNLE